MSMSEISMSEFADISASQYRCGSCGSDFPTYSDCVAHMKTHSVELNCSQMVADSAAASTEQHTYVTAEKYSLFVSPEEENNALEDSAVCSAQLSSLSTTTMCDMIDSDKTNGRPRHLGTLPQVVEMVGLPVSQSGKNNVFVETKKDIEMIELPVSQSLDKTILVEMDHFGVVNVQLGNKEATTGFGSAQNSGDVANSNFVDGIGKSKKSQVPETKHRVFTDNVNNKHMYVASNRDIDVISAEPQTLGTGDVEALNNTKNIKTDRPYACAECPARYRFLSSLSVHKKRHSGSEPYQCLTCGKKFWHPTNLRVHQRTHTQERPFRCKVCGRGFNQSNDLRIHRRIHTGEMPLKCPVIDCGRAFRDPACLRRHVNKHRGMQPHIECDKCSAKFFHPSGLARHYKRHTGEKDHACNVCHATFARGDTLKLHMRTHSGQKPYSCSVCLQAFSDRSYCRRHISKHSESEKPRVISALKGKDLLKHEPSEEGDDSCTEKTDAVYGLPKIVQGKSDSAEMQPQTVQKKMDIVEVQPQTVQKKMIVPVQIPDPNGSDIPYASIEIELPESDFNEKDGSQEIMYQYGDMLITISRSAVDLSDKSMSGVVEASQVSAGVGADSEQLPSPIVLNVQQEEHQYSRVVPFAKTEPKDSHLIVSEIRAVEDSSQVTADLSAATVNSGMNISQYQSEYGDLVTSIMEGEPGKKFFPTGKEKQRSPRIGERKWPCPDCDLAFFHQAELKRHQTKHTGELPYQCTVCGKRARDPSNLKRHLRTHTGERPYRCTVCQKTFRQPGHLTSHARIHTGERPYKCDICNATFIESNHLQYHKKVHAGVKPFHCSKCDLRFVRNAELKRHMHVHGVEGSKKCDLCYATFCRSDALKQHMRKKHKLNPPFQCNVCSQSFFRQSLLDKHQDRMRHRQDSPALQDKVAKAKCDVENSVVADALCELAAGRRQADSSVNNDTVLSLPTACPAPLSWVASASAAVKSSPDAALPGQLIKSTGSVQSQSSSDQSHILKDCSAVFGSGKNSVQRVMVDGGSVSGSRLVLVESASPAASRLRNDVQSTPYIQTQNIDDSGFVPRTKERMLEIEKLIMTEKADHIIINSSENTSNAVLAQYVSSVSGEQDCVEINQEHAALINVVNVSSGTIHSSEISCLADNPSAQDSTVAIAEPSPQQDTAPSDEAQTVLVMSAAGIDEQTALASTMQSLVSGVAQLETVPAVELAVVRSPRGRKGKCGQKPQKQTVKQKTNSGSEEAKPIVAPLRTRSGRERKIKLKFSA